MIFLDCRLKCSLKKLNLLLIPVLLLVVGLSFSACKKQRTGTGDGEGSSGETGAGGVENTEALSEEDYSEYEFYSSATDDASWVESLLAQIEEERIAEELRAMEESLQEYDEENEADDYYSEDEVEEQSEDSSEGASEETEAPEGDESDINEEEPEESVSEVEKFFQTEKSGTVKLQKNRELKFYEFDNEIFSQQKIDGKPVLIHSEGNSTTRYFYDEKYQLVKKETWNIPSVQNAELKKSESFEYFKDSSVVSAKTIKENGFYEKVNYNADGKLIKSERYAETEKKNYIVSRRKLSYNKDGKVLSDELTDYYYEKDNYEELEYSFVKKYTYAYNEGEIPPDFQYYENGILKMQNKYSAQKGTYTSRIFFEDGFSVKTYYEDEIRVKDIYYSGNKVLREKVYEKVEQEVEVEKAE